MARGSRLPKNKAAEMGQKEFIIPSSKEIGAIFVEHIERLAELLNDERPAVLQARKLAKYYARGLHCRSRFCAEINECDNLTDLKTICCRYFI